MVTTTVSWLKDRHFVGTDSNNHSVVLSGQKEGIGLSPSEMLLIALASCSSVDVVEILEKKTQNLDAAGGDDQWRAGSGSALGLSENSSQISPRRTRTDRQSGGPGH